jgi:hypothetical protein
MVFMRRPTQESNLVKPVVGETIPRKAASMPGMTKPLTRPTAGGTAPRQRATISTAKLLSRGPNGHKAVLAALKAQSANLPTPPTTYDVTKTYRVQLSRSVEINSRWLRPTQDVVVSGTVAQSIATAISGAIAL